MNNKYYFTFGSNKGFPYQNGYVIVIANSLGEAIEKFRKKFPDRNKNIVNCAFWYTQEHWDNTGMEKSYLCYETIE